MKVFVCIFCLCMPAFLCGQNFNSEVEAIINTNDNKNDILEVTGIAQNKTNVSYGLRYELSVITSNPKVSNNSSKNSQSGFFTLEPYETSSLSTTSVSINPQMQTIILLLIYDEEDQLMGTARKVYEPISQAAKNEKLSYKKDNEGIQLYGLVTENTKTKPGKDFYDFFYQKYQLSQNPENKIIEIDEMISFGRTTKIMVKIENQIVFQFYSRPKLDYLEEMAGVALQRVNRYFQNLRRQKQQIMQY